jgi:hypothetical protein
MIEIPAQKRETPKSGCLSGFLEAKAVVRGLPDKRASRQLSPAIPDGAYKQCG